MLDNNDAQAIKDQVAQILDGQDFVLITWGHEDDLEKKKREVRRDVLTSLDDAAKILGAMSTVMGDVAQICHRNMKMQEQRIKELENDPIDN